MLLETAYQGLRQNNTGFHSASILKQNMRIVNRHPLAMLLIQVFQCKECFSLIQAGEVVFPTLKIKMRFKEVKDIPRQSELVYAWKIQISGHLVYTILVLLLHSIQFSSVAQSCLTLCDPMNCSTPGLPIHHQLPGSTQTHVHRISGAIQPSHPLSSPSPPALNLSQHQGLFQ